jgi:hypothetical protein
MILKTISDVVPRKAHAAGTERLAARTVRFRVPNGGSAQLIPFVVQVPYVVLQAQHVARMIRCAAQIISGRNNEN